MDFCEGSPQVDLTLEVVVNGQRVMLAATIDPNKRHWGQIKALCAHEKIRLQWCGIEPRTWKLLAAHKIHCLGDLKQYTERQVCERLLAPEERLTQETVDVAIARFIRMRDRLKAINITHNPCGVETELATAAQLRAVVYA